ncbi:hypothetical protein JAAARDRAFT_457719 [Jaapia argillacea MUCL 33604]|uniref:Transmembrane protein n=1 Tax=Jaapia argillacea MUCL 33604 TaxID=933084 RepID=A0A067Q887_9AGAM|nr:hypothetical protein JAAARDRAFT_457719 [Jaapia argillacea MUCL 33604]
MLRVWALYGRSRKVFLLSLVCYILDVATGLVAASVTLASEQTIPQMPGLPVTGCFLSQTPAKHTWLIAIGWAVHVAINAIYFGLTLYKFVASVSGAGLNPRESWKLAPLLSLFIRDGTVYFLIIFGMCLPWFYGWHVCVCSDDNVPVSALYNLVIMLIYTNRPLVIVGESLMAATYAVTSSRLILGLHKSVNTSEFATESEDIEMHGHATSRDKPVFATRSGVSDATTTTLASH